MHSAGRSSAPPRWRDLPCRAHKSQWTNRHSRTWRCVRRQIVCSRRSVATETRLRGWACKTRTQKCRRKISLRKVAQISGDPAEFRPQRLFAFELRRCGEAARPSARTFLRECWSVAEMAGIAAILSACFLLSWTGPARSDRSQRGLGWVAGDR
jgi:hypothetical protein